MRYLCKHGKMTRHTTDCFQCVTERNKRYKEFEESQKSKNQNQKGEDSEGK